MSSLIDSSNNASTTGTMAAARFRRIWPSDIARSVVVGIVVGISMSVGAEFYHTSGAPDYRSKSMWLSAVAIAAGTAIVSLACLAAWNVHWQRQYTDHAHAQGGKLAQRIRTMNPTALRTITFLVILALWIPAAIAFFPGNYSSDAPLQLRGFFNGHFLDDHWPIAHTLVLAACMDVGNWLFSNLSAGVFIYCLIQAVLLAFALSLSLQKFISWGSPVGLTIVAHLVIIANPYVQTYVMTTAKDAMFAGFFLLTLLCIIQAIRTPSCFTSVGYCIGFFISALGMCLMRKQGLYILIVVLILLLFVHAMRRVRWRLALLAVLIVCATVLFPTAVGSVYTIQKTDLLDQLSLPSQQIVATYMYDHDGLTEQDIDSIGQYYDLTALDAGLTSTNPWTGMPGIGQYYNTDTGTGYLEPLADPAKGALKTDAVKQDMAGYLKLYLNLGSKHPYRYLTALLWDTAGYVYPTSLANNYFSGLASWNAYNITLDIAPQDRQPQDYHQSWKPQLLMGWFLAAADFYKPLLNVVNRSRHPALSGPCSLLIPWVSPALVFYVLVMSCALICSRKKFANQSHTGEESPAEVPDPRREDGKTPDASSAMPKVSSAILLIPWSFEALYWCSLLFAPVMCGRYAFPVFFASAAIFCLPWIQLRDAKAPAKADDAPTASSEESGESLEEDATVKERDTQEAALPPVADEASGTSPDSPADALTDNGELQ